MLGFNMARTWQVVYIEHFSYIAKYDSRSRAAMSLIQHRCFSSFLIN
jgi:hypothetical protein